MTLFTASQTMPFGVAIVIMVGLGVIEAIGLLVATSPSEFVDRQFLLSDTELEGPLGWLHLGKVPLLVLLILFLLGFGLSGYLVQMLWDALSGSYMPALLAAVPASIAGFYTVHGMGGLLAHIIPKDETSAVSEQSLIGRTGTVVTGTARQGLAAQVKVRDQYGNQHYLMVEPDMAEEEFEEGSEVLIVKKQGAIYRGIRNPHPALI